MNQGLPQGEGDLVARHLDALRESKRRKALREFVVRFELPWYVCTAVLYAVAVLLVVLVFPDVSNVWVAVFVLLGGLTASVGTLITAIKSRAPEEGERR